MVGGGGAPLILGGGWWGRGERQRGRGGGDVLARDGEPGVEGGEGSGGGGWRGLRLVAAVLEACSGRWRRSWRKKRAGVAGTAAEG